MRDIGQNIRTLRMRHNMRQEELAQALHVTRQTISNYETGRSRPDVEMLAALAEALGVDVQEVLYGPTGQETRQKQLRHLAVGAVLTVTLGLLYHLGNRWAQELLHNTYLAAPSWFLQIYLRPFVYSLLAWTLTRGCIVLSRATFLVRPWTV